MIGLLLHLLKFSPVSLDPRSLWDNAINAFDLTVLSTPAHEIVARIGARCLNWNARNVMKAFIKAAIQAHAETNCLVRIFFILDVDMRAKGANLSTVSSHIMQTEIMFEEALERADQMDKEFAATGQLKGRLHGIPVSLKDQLMSKGLIQQSAFQIFGHTHNPHKRGFTCGGRSGGEAALLASDGSCLGIGGKSANSGALLRVLQPETDDLIETSSPCRRAVEETVDALKLAGYDCVEIDLWEELGLDGLICPTQAVPAVPIGSSWNKSFLAESTLIWNLVDSTVGHIPITRVDIQRDQIRSDANSMTNAPKRSGDMWRVKDLLPSVEETEGLPVGIQLVCGFLEEEKTLALMGIIVKSWNNRPKQTAPLPKPGDFLGKKQGLGVAKSHP
ncbi:hypothetical protein H4Q26_010002 [Puccinia striiformis f. sp. tritici PST-130]|nr:hypothetical protein H4Q26_010002 [Puccinia striiformis f. sp. tritici PST-130]